jgi:hypothetical protein
VSVDVARPDLTSFERYLWFWVVGAVAAMVVAHLIDGVGRVARHPSD